MFRIVIRAILLFFLIFREKCQFVVALIYAFIDLSFCLF